MMTDSTGVDLSSLNLLSDVALVFQWEIGKDSNGFDGTISKSTTMASLNVLVSAAETIATKGLLVDLGFFSIHKKIRSKANNKKSKLCLRSDLLGFVVPKKKRSSLDKFSSDQGRKRKRIDVDFDYDRSIDFENERVKRQRSSSHVQLVNSEQEFTKNTPLWLFQRKSQLRFSLVKLTALSARTTMVN